LHLFGHHLQLYLRCTDTGTSNYELVVNTGVPLQFTNTGKIFKILSTKLTR